MYKINDTVLYGKYGVCKIDNIAAENFTGKNMEYYCLKPAYSEGTVIYVPRENDRLVSKMKKVLSKEEIDELIFKTKNTELIWYADEKVRKDKYNAILSEGDRGKILQLINALYINKTEREAIGKKMYACDEKIMKEAERLIHEEFAVVLNIKPDEVVDYIVNKIEED
ncbi:MAG: CarD family transcriptional regulator [Clostridia bacterium]|nr:CarD family transcriptional regulator [Clostridia bacterium]